MRKEEEGDMGDLSATNLQGSASYTEYMCVHIYNVCSWWRYSQCWDIQQIFYDQIIVELLNKLYKRRNCLRTLKHNYKISH